MIRIDGIANELKKRLIRLRDVISDESITGADFNIIVEDIVEQIETMIHHEVLLFKNELLMEREEDGTKHNS